MQVAKENNQVCGKSWGSHLLHSLKKDKRGSISSRTQLSIHKHKVWEGELHQLGGVLGKPILNVHDKSEIADVTVR